MNEITAITLQAMQQDMVRLDRLGMNLANALTPGYRREVTGVRPFAGHLGATATTGDSGGLGGTGESAAAGAGHGSRSIGAGEILVRADPRPGSVRATGHKLDLALSGPGYFEVATQYGPAYTRQGNFGLDAQGRLVTAQGHAVMGKGGEIILTQNDVQIDANGELHEVSGIGNGLSLQGLRAPGTQNPAMPLAQIKVVQFDHPDRLHRVGDGLLFTDEAAAGMRDGDFQIRQGYLENSNVNALQEMVDLMQTMRHFESMHKVIQGYDEMLGNAIQKLS